MTTTVIVGKKSDAADERSGTSGARRGSRAKSTGRWTSPISTRRNEGGEELPEYRISFKLHENGLTRDLVMDYGDFSMKGKLVDLKTFDQPPQTCP